MISGKLVHLIETHATGIIDRVVYQIRHEEDMSHIRALLDSELREWNLELLEHLTHWLNPANREDLAHRYERLGKMRFEQDVPLYESVRGLCLMREKTLDFVEEHIASNSSVELYAEEELDRRVGIFFDLLIAHLARGYERALRRAACPTV
ncbi:MAG TPA: hypothetical protein VG456_01740 [Candidatus Sulfopaludibacter sp.]|jgi:hypothetical protein|nr:hypothetical protein [Candidatus Sulfopaludibacter sp.]